MNNPFKHIQTLMAVVAMGALLVACADDDNYSIKEARIDISGNVLGQLEAYSYATPFNLVTDADAEWEATMEWDAKKNAQPAYVYPKTGTGPALLKIATFDNPTQSPRQAVLKITFPKDPSKNIVQTITQKRGADSNGSKDISYGNKTRGIGYGYNCFDGYAETACITVPILKVDQMYDDKKLLYDFSTLRVEQREESGASVDELASKLNGTMHAAASNWGLSASVDAKFSGGQKSTASNEFAWMDINATTCTASFNGPQSILIFDYMTDEAYADMNGLERWSEKKQKDIVFYPATDEGFAQLVMDYGTHLVVSGKLGGQLHTQITANTSKITTAYNVSAALEATYGGPYSIDANGKAKTQWAHAQSRNHSAFYFAYELRGGSLDDGAVTALSSVLDKMTKARQGAGTENDEVRQLLIEAFGKETYHHDGTLNRQHLSEVAFGDDKALARLNGIVHPATARDMQQWARRQADSGARVAFVETALLRTAGLDRLVDEELTFWGEWEPQSHITRITNPQEDGCSPHVIHRPLLDLTEPVKDSKNRYRQNTDPFVFREQFLYRCCQQTRKTGPTQLAHLLPGSIVLFGSRVNGLFAVDTVFVVESYHDYCDHDCHRRRYHQYYFEYRKIHYSQH